MIEAEDGPGTPNVCPYPIEWRGDPASARHTPRKCATCHALSLTRIGTVLGTASFGNGLVEE